ncbi:hypothetical protein N656DRAFT_808294 [Canariomyces notabilis]|uniref:VHS domain-containing protein n=1 Tax=Canariomyces notabilis TaxID=2074819 RepID=A0AAN6TBR2_9PEZI|nr:hypothetical protein N656DRAFT_808294 [Canariomyces arenarius]
MFSQKKPYTAVTVTIERLTSEAIPENDYSGIPDLVEVVNLQDTGPAEAARAIRKKLKYGNLHRQLRALTLLDGLIQNAGPRFQRTFADEALLERLRFCATAALSDPEVKKKCSELFRGWAAEYKNTRGMERIASLYQELPRRKQAVTQERSRVIKETDNPFGDDDEEDKPSPAGPSKAHSRNSSLNPPVTGVIQSFSYDAKEKKKKEKKQKKHKPFNIETEKEQMKAHIAEASISATNLMNTLKTINREKERISENQIAVQHFEMCKQLRRKILRYIHLVDSEQWLGSLLHANDELVAALMTFEQLDRSIDADSDSDDELAEQAHLYRMMTEKAKGKEPSSPSSPKSPVSGMAGLSISSPQSPRPAPPPRPSAATKPSMLSPRSAPLAPASDDEEDEEDEENPFADRNALLKGE